MPSPKLHHHFDASKLSYVSVVVLLAGIFIAVISSRSQQEQRSRASGGLVVTGALVLNKTVYALGETITGTLTYTNTSSSSISVQNIGIFAKKPNGYNLVYSP